MKLTGIILAAAIALTINACSKEKVYDAPVLHGKTMMLYTQTQDGGSGSSGSQNGGQAMDEAVFLFWDFGDVIADEEYPVPMLVCYPANNINDYSRPNTPFNTGSLYPDGGLRVMATGYAPASRLAPEVISGGEKNYLELDLDESGICVTDVLTSVNTVVGSAALPFDRPDGEPMKFMHALSKISFLARQDESMEDTEIYYRRVRIRPSEANIARKFIWNRTEGRYDAEAEISGADDFPYTLDEGENARQLTPQMTNNIGSFYIAPGSSLHVQVTVTRSNDVSFSQSEEVTFETGIPFNIPRDPQDPDDVDMHGNPKSSDRIYPGEAYTFTLRFKQEGIEITGKKCAWENGGSIIIPVYPILPDDSNDSEGGGI